MILLLLKVVPHTTKENAAKEFRHQFFIFFITIKVKTISLIFFPVSILLGVLTKQVTEIFSLSFSNFKTLLPTRPVANEDNIFH